MRFTTSFLQAVVLLLMASANSAASTLFLQNGFSLYEVNQTAGSTSLIGSDSLSGGKIEDLTTRPGETNFIYGIKNSTPTRLVKVNVNDGSQVLGPFLNEVELGIPKLFATGIAISPLDGNVAVVSGFDSAFDESDTAGQHFIWHVDVDTGAVLGNRIQVPSIGPLTFSLDGGTLYSAGLSGELVTINLDTGALSEIGDPGLSNFLEGLAFRPEDGKLFAIDGFRSDNLVELNPTDGSLISIIGGVGVLGAHGLTFVIPEPTTLTLAAFAVLGVYCRRRRAV